MTGIDEDSERQRCESGLGQRSRMSPEPGSCSPHHYDHLVLAFLGRHDGGGGIACRISESVCKLTGTAPLLARRDLDTHADVCPGSEQRPCLHHLCLEVAICDPYA